MNGELVLQDLSEGIARLTLNRPHCLNSFNVAMHGELRDALARLAQDDACRVVVLTGAGRGFCAGQDLSERVVEPGAEPVDLGTSVEKYYVPLVLALRAMPKPVIAAVNGVAAGAGANIALACDIVIAARSASFIQSFVRVGLIPDSGGTWLLPRRVGAARAAGLALLGEPLSAERAADWGMIWKCVDDPELPSAVRVMARSLAALPSGALACTKRALQAAQGNSFDAQLALERDSLRVLGASKEYAEAVARFVNRPD